MAVEFDRQQEWAGVQTLAQVAVEQDRLEVTMQEDSENIAKILISGPERELARRRQGRRVPVRVPRVATDGCARLDGWELACDGLMRWMAGVTGDGRTLWRAW